MKVLVISDNHGDRSSLLKALREAEYDVSIHLGDSELSEEWISNNFTYYVEGNHDNYKYQEIMFDIEGLKIAALHGHTIGVSAFSKDKHLDAYAKGIGADMVLYGHTHIYNVSKIGKTTMISPGSCYLSRGPEGNSYCIITIEKGQLLNVELKRI